MKRALAIATAIAGAGLLLGSAAVFGLRAPPSPEVIEPVWTEIYGWSPFEWGEGVVFMRVDPTSMWSYAAHPEDFPE